MIKILVEEPVVYNDFVDELDDTNNWIYKNPTQKEIDEINYKKTIRFLTYKNDIYLASGWTWIHKEMADALKSYNKLNYDEYKCYLIHTYENYLSTGDKYYGLSERNEVLMKLKPFIPRLKELGLLDDDTNVINYYNSNRYKLKEFYGDVV